MKIKYYLLILLITILMIVSCISETGEVNYMEVSNIQSETSVDNANTGSITLTWSEPNSPDFASTIITYFDDENPNGVESVYEMGTASITFEGLTNGTIYDFLIQTVDKVGNKSAGVEASVSLMDVVNMSVTGDSSEAVISWTEPAGDDFNGVDIEFYIGINHIDITVEKGTTSQSVYGMVNGEDYEFLIKSQDINGNYSDGVTVDFTALPSYIDEWEEVTVNADWGERDDHTSLVYDDKMWVIGGTDLHTEYEYDEYGNIIAANSFLIFKNEVWSSEDGLNWTESIPRVEIWSARGGHSSVVFDDKMWVIGGFGDNVFYDSELPEDETNPKYITNNEVWYTGDSGLNWVKADTSGGDIFPPINKHSSVVFDDKMWVLGGIEHVDLVYGSTYCTNQVWSSEDGITWQEVVTNGDYTSGTMWSPRGMHKSVVFDGKMWVIGGRDHDGNSSNEVWSSSDGVNWTLVNTTGSTSNDTLWSERGAFSLVVLNDRLWLMGGYDHYDDGTTITETFMNDVWSSSDGDIWEESGPVNNDSIWHIRAFHTSVIFDNRIWVMGGDVGSYSVDDIWHSM